MAKRRKMPKEKYFRVAIEFEEGTARCTPDEAQLYYDDPGKPDSVRWAVGRMPTGATRLVVKWDVASPFIHLGVEVPQAPGESLVLLGTGNVRETGVFHYSVMAVNEEGQILAGVDPRIRNDPWEPVSG
jgi:hypothetical protein